MVPHRWTARCSGASLSNALRDCILVCLDKSITKGQRESIGMDHNVIVSALSFAAAGMLLFVAMPDRRGASPHFLRFEAAPILYQLSFSYFWLSGWPILSRHLPQAARLIVRERRWRVARDTTTWRQPAALSILHLALRDNLIAPDWLAP